MMTMLMAIFSLREWLKNPFEGNRAEVRVNILNRNDILLITIGSILVTIIFYFILDYFNTANIIFSTISVATSFLAAALTYRRSHYFALAYAANDVVLIFLWLLASLVNFKYILVVICFIAFFFNDLYGYISWKRMKSKQMKLNI